MSSARNRLLLAGILAAGAIVYLLGPILTPFLAGFILAYLGDPLVDRLERHRLSRGAATLMVFLLTLAALALLLLLVIPMAVNELAALFARIPGVIGWLNARALPWLAAHLHVNLRPLAPENFAALASENFASAGKLAGNALLSVSRSGAAVFGFFLNLVLIPVVTFYLLRDWDLLVARIAAVLPRDRAPLIGQLARECDAVLGAFLKGQLLVMVSLAVFYGLGLSLIGLGNAVAIGVIVGLLSFIPYLGVTIGVSLALLAALLQAQNWVLPATVVGVFVIGHLLESFVLTPRFVGERIGLHPVLVIFAVLAGGQLFGFAGVLLALPAAAAGTVLVRHLHAHYMQSSLYQGSDGDGP